MTPVAASLLVLLVLALVLLAASVATRRRPEVGLVPDREGYFDRWSVLHGGYDPRPNWWARNWLALTYACSRPLARAGVQPDVLTAWGLVVSLGVVVTAAAGGRWPLLGILVVTVSGLFDNIDGCVAVLTERTTRWGAVIDSLVDRVADALYLLAFVILGAPVGLAVLAGGVTYLQEYARSKAGNAGMDEIGVATIWERPTRVTIAGWTLGAAGVFVGHHALAATVGTAVCLGLALLGITQLLVVVRRRLSAPV